jgi:hypothetical protein
MKNTPTTAEVCTFFKDNTDFNALFSIVRSVNKDLKLNDRMFRFIKGRLIELAISECTTNIRYVDKIGYDIEIFDFPSYSGSVIKIEIKSGISMVYTRKTGRLKTNTSLIRLNNSIGEAKNLNLKCDYLLLIDLHSLYLVEPKVINKYAVNKKDGYTVHFPVTELHHLASPDYFTVSDLQFNLSIVDRIDKLMKNYIAEHVKEING